MRNDVLKRLNNECIELIDQIIKGDTEKIHDYRYKKGLLFSLAKIIEKRRF